MHLIVVLIYLSLPGCKPLLSRGLRSSRVRIQAEGPELVAHPRRAGEQGQEKATPMMSALPKNLNLPWVVTTSLAIWFLFVHTPPFWIQRKIIPSDPLLAAHIVAAGTIYMACAHNCLFTPSSTLIRWGEHKFAKVAHELVGRTGLIAGIGSFFLGAFLAWSRVKVLTLGFAVPITIGGIFQLNGQWQGFVAIRKYKMLKQQIEMLSGGGRGESTHLFSASDSPDRNRRELVLEGLLVEKRIALRQHIGNMISVFVMACGIPAGIRLAEQISGGTNRFVTVLTILTMIGCLNVVTGRYIRVMQPNRLEQRPEAAAS
jgi:hypothetical protein